MRKTYHFTGFVTAVSPLTFTPPTGKERGYNNGGIDGNKNHSLPTLGDRVIFPASGLRGKLRRAATAVVSKELSRQAGEDHKFRLEDYFFASLGGVKQGKGAKQESDAADDTDAKAADTKGVLDVSKLLYIREHNPLVSLFGAMDPLAVSGLASIGHAYCQTGLKAETVRQVRSNDLIRNTEAWEMLDEDAYEKLSAMVSDGKDKSAIKAKIKEIRGALRKAEGAAKEELDAELKQLTEADKADSTVNIQQPGLNYQCIPAGAKMDFRMTLKNVSEQELSLFLRALAMFGFYPVIGSHVSQGCGTVAMNLDVFEQGDFAPSKIGNIAINGDYTGIVMSEVVQKLAEVPLELNQEAFSAEHVMNLQGESGVKKPKKQSAKAQAQA